MTFCVVFYLLFVVVTILSFVPHSLLTHLLLSVQCFIFCLPQSQSCPSFLIHYSPIYYFLCSVLSSVCRSHNLVLRSSFITHPSIAFCVVFYLLFAVVTILSFVPHSLLTHLLLSVQCFIFCLPQSQSCPSFLIHYSPIYYFLCSVLSSVCRSHNLVLRSSFITHQSIAFCVVFYPLFAVVTILSFVPHSLLTHLLLSVQCFIFCLPQSQSCPSFLIHYSPIYCFLCSVLSSVCRSHNLVLRSSFITHPSIAFCIVFYLLFAVVTILSFVPHSLLTHLLLSVQCFIFCLRSHNLVLRSSFFTTLIYCFLYSVLSSVCRSHNLVLRSSFITHPSIAFCVVFYPLFAVVTILSFVPHSLLTHLLLSVQCFIFCLPQSQSCPSFLIQYSPIYYFLCSVLSSVCRSPYLVLRSSFITHPSITFCVMFYLLFAQSQSCPSFLIHYSPICYFLCSVLSSICRSHNLVLRSVQRFIFCLPQSQSCRSFLIHYAPIYCFLCSVLSSVCRSHNLVLRSSFITHPSIAFCIVFYLLFVVVTILSFVPHSLLTHLLLSVQCFIFCLPQSQSCPSFLIHYSPIYCFLYSVLSSFCRSHNLVLRSSFITHPSIAFCVEFYLLFAVVTILSFVPHSILTHLLFSVQCFIFCLPQSQSCPSFCVAFCLLFAVVTILSFVPHSLLTHLLLSVQCFIFCLPQSQSCPSFLIHYSPIYYFLCSVLSSICRSHNLVRRSVQRFIFCLPQSQSCPSFLIHYSPIYCFLYSVLSSVYRSHNIVLRSSFITHTSITFCVVFYLLFVLVTILSFVPHSFLIHYSPIYYFLYSVLSSVCRSHNLVLRSSFITHPSITFCVVFYLLFAVVTILSFVHHSLLTHLLLSVQCFIFCLSQSQSCPSFLIHYSPIYCFLCSILSSVCRSHNLVLRSSFITHPSITFCVVFYLLFAVVTILSFVPHSLLTHLLLSVQCFFFCLPQSQSCHSFLIHYSYCPSFLIHYSPIYCFLCSVLSSVCRSHNLVLRSSFITHPSITFCVVFYLLFAVVTILSFVPHSLLTHLLLSVQCFFFCLPQSQSCHSFLIHYSPIYCFLCRVLSSICRSHNLVLRSSFNTHPSIIFCVVFYLLFAVVTILSFVLCSVLSSVCRSHNIVLRSSFVTHPSITFCIVFYLLYAVVTILSFVPHSLLTHLLLSVQCFIFYLPQSQSCPSFCVAFYILFAVVTILSFVPHSLFTHLLLSVQCFIFCLPQSQSCPSFLILY